jgi:uncharacterized metal-binding protein YceD (DUF177 family)
MTTRPLLVTTIDVASIPATGHAVRIEASPPERQAIAREYGLLEVRSLGADLDVGRGADRSLTVTGRIHAEIVQTCVVSLEPVTQLIDDGIDVRYVAGGGPAATAPRPGAEVQVDPKMEPPELLSGDEVDLGALVLEHFALGIDPYPKAAGAELPGEPDDADRTPADSPFAVLARLTNRE